jgi:hypothetical protein
MAITSGAGPHNHLTVVSMAGMPPRVEITPAMRDAGAFELFVLLGAVESSYSFEEVASAVFKRMLAQCRAFSEGAVSHVKK